MILARGPASRPIVGIGRCVLLTVCLGLVFGTVAQAAGEGDGKGAVLKAADFTAKDIDGKTVTLSELLKSGPVLLDFWTTWCGPCKKEMPELDKLHQTYKDKGFKVLAIAQDDPKTAQKVKPMIQSQKYSMVVIADSDKEIGRKYNVRQYPTSFLVSQDGTIAHYAQGYLPGDEKKLEGLVRGLLGLGAEDTKDSGQSQ